MKVTVVSGVALALFGMWGSAWLGHILEKWAELPALITAILSISCGFAISVYALENQK